jgi:aminoglycoside phosphotransferase (APT) family kinase protein
LPDYDILRDWLGANVPEEVEPAVVHGDYKLDNVIVVAPGRIEAVVDWEMATVGDPRADLGYLLFFWPEPGIDMPLGDLFPPTAGFPSRAELIEQWAQVSGRPVPGDELRWFEALAIWKLAILLEASYHRWLAGMSDDDFFSRLEVGVPALLARAREVAHV